MRNYIGYIIDYSDGSLSERKRKWFDSELMQNDLLRHEFSLFNHVNSLMRARADIEEIENDTELKEVDVLTKQMVSVYHNNPEKFDSAKGFINSTLADNNINFTLQEEINLAAEEAKKNNINSITKDWVDEYNASNRTESDENYSRKAFISSSINDDNQHVVAPNTRKSKKYLALRVVGYAAAAFIAGLLVVKTLIPSNKPDDVYQDFYKPLNAYSSTTRSNSSKVDPYANAVEKYKMGQFQIAGVMFSDLIYEDPSNISYRFFSGITQLELANYDQSIELLNEVIKNNGEFRKEAKWYLSLAYIKYNKPQLASDLLTELSIEKGYYQRMAQDLLERIK